MKQERRASTLRACQFHNRANRRCVSVSAFERKRFLQREREVGILIHEHAQKTLIDVHDSNHAGDLSLAVLDLDLFVVAHLFWFIRELLVVLESFLRVGHVILKGAVRVCAAQSVEAIAVKEAEVFGIRAIGQTILRDDNAGFAATGFVHERGDPSAFVRAAHINHPGPKRAEHVVAVVEKFLRGPEMDLLGHAVGINDGRPQRGDFGQAGLAKAGIGFAAIQRVECGFDFRPVAGFHRIEESLDDRGNGHALLFGHGVHHVTARAGKLFQFGGDDFLRGGGRGWRRRRSAREGVAFRAGGSGTDRGVIGRCSGSGGMRLRGLTHAPHDKQSD